MLTRQAVFPGALGSGGAPPRRQRAAPAAGAELHTSGIFHGAELGVARAIKAWAPRIRAWQKLPPDSLMTHGGEAFFGIRFNVSLLVLDVWPLL